MIAIVDYGAGNIFSVKNALDYLGLDCKLTSDKDEIKAADAVILPGVGAFPAAMAMLEKSGLIDTIKEEAAKKPLLGICLGMQMLFDESHEFGCHKGLGLIPGKVVTMHGVIAPELKIPQMGWNALHFPNAELKASSPVFRDIDEGEFVYFVHSYYASECDADVVAVCDCGVPITAAVVRGNVMGCQFHPEKSSRAGLKILKNFCEGDFGGAR